MKAIIEKECARFVVTASEFEKAAELEAELTRFDLQLSGSRRLLPRERVKKLREEYSANPTSENLRALEEGLNDRALMAQGTRSLANLALRREIFGMYLKFVNGTVIPWARPIVERGLVLERARFQAVADEENEKHQILCGSPMCTSHVVTRARTPLTNVERIASSLKHTDAAILRQHLFRGLERFR